MIKKSELKTLEDALLLIEKLIATLTQKRKESIDAYVKVNAESYLNNIYVSEYGFDTPQFVELLK